jgi:hypothetical protein
MTAEPKTALEEQTPSRRLDPSFRSLTAWSTKRVAGFITVIAALATAVAAIIGVVFTLSPNLKPEPLPPKRSAELSELALDPNARYSQYIDRLRVKRLRKSDFTPEKLREQGAVVSFRVRMVGYKDEPLHLDWQLIDVSTGRELHEDRSTVFIPSVNDDEATKDIWVAYPRQDGPFRLEIQLLLQRGNNFVVLSRLETKEFERRVEQ